MNSYRVQELVGEGSFGRVYKGRKICTCQVSAAVWIKVWQMYDCRPLCLNRVFPPGCGSKVHPEGGSIREGAAKSEERDRDHERSSASTHRPVLWELWHGNWRVWTVVFQNALRLLLSHCLYNPVTEILCNRLWLWLSMQRVSCSRFFRMIGTSRRARYSLSLNRWTPKQVRAGLYEDERSAIYWAVRQISAQ